jgi:hypothetical protein
VGLFVFYFYWNREVMGNLTEFFMQRRRSCLHPKTVSEEKGDAALPGQPKIPQGEKDKDMNRNPDQDRRYFSLLSAVLASLLLVLASWLAGGQSALGQSALEIPSGTSIKVRMIDNLSSEQAQMGDTFRGTLDWPIMVNGRELYPKGADVIGRVTGVHATGRLSDPGELDLVLNTVSSGTVAASINVEPLVIKGESHTKSNATKIGGGAALGAVIGAIAGGGKGAAIGTLAGGAAGTGAAAATGKNPAIVESEAILTFVTSSASVGTAPPPPPASPAPSEASPAPASPVPPPADSTSSPDPATEPDNGTPLFSLRDQRTIRSCVNEHAADFAAATQRSDLPSGAERQIHRGGNLPSEIQDQAQSLPLACEEQLPKLPGNLERVIYGGRALLIDSKGRVLDMFYLDQNQ